ncbi:MAG TPA: hypothetical protein ENI23_15390 [bacterium]|nr:hypothetical protein [bacterium]
MKRKCKKGQVGGLLVSGIVAILVGVAMLPIFTSLIDEAQIIQENQVEQVTNTNNGTATLTNDDLISGSITMTNATCDDAPTCVPINATPREGFEFSVNEKSGVISFINISGTWNTTYSFEPSGYVDTATGRTVVKQVTLMYGVALIIITLASVGIFVTRK